MKEDLAGGRLPSGDFGENAAWWWIMILAFNLNAVLKSLVLGGKWIHKRMKAMRFYLIKLPARVMGRSRGLSLRFKTDTLPMGGCCLAVLAGPGRVGPSYLIDISELSSQ